jgi:hypothetical protein
MAGALAKACNPLGLVATRSGTAGLDENDSTLPVPSSGSNDCANTGVVMTVSIANAVKSFFTFRLL